MTQRRLVLVRHAKTEQGEPDPSRRLTNRGRRDARAIGQWLAKNGVVPDLVVVSPAARARQTWEIAAPELSTAASVAGGETDYRKTPQGPHPGRPGNHQPGQTPPPRRH